MRLHTRLGVLLLLASVATAGQAAAATVRGRVIRGNAAAAGIKVTLLGPNKVRTLPATSGPDGMYYIPNVKPGNYTLEVWAIPSQPPMTFPIQVKDQPETDINPAIVP